MVRRYRLGVAGLVHDHVWNELDRWQATGRAEVMAAAEPAVDLQERVRADYSCQLVYSSVEEMLDQAQPEIVQVCGSNAAGAEAVLQCAARGIPVIIEKPLAATLEQAEAMLEAATKAGILLMVNWPNRWRPATVAAWELVQQGAAGEIFAARMRMAHCGPRKFGCSDHFCNWLYDPVQNGGGALVDYCCYGAASFRHLFGMPQAVEAISDNLATPEIPVEDNAAITMIYEKRRAVAEASWTQIPSYHDAVYYGTEGTIWTEEGRVWLATSEHSREEAPVKPLPEGRRTGPEMFLACLENGETPPDVCHPALCRDVQEILAAGQLAAARHCRVSLPLNLSTE